MIEIGIVNVEKVNENDKANRELEITMTSGSVIHVLPCCESWQQYGGLLEEEWATVGVAKKYNKWLHGIG